MSFVERLRENVYTIFFLAGVLLTIISFILLFTFFLNPIMSCVQYQNKSFLDCTHSRYLINYWFAMSIGGMLVAIYYFRSMKRERNQIIFYSAVAQVLAGLVVLLFIPVAIIAFIVAPDPFSFVVGIPLLFAGFGISGIGLLLFVVGILYDFVQRVRK